MACPKHGINIPFRRILLDHFENFNLQQIRQVRNITLEFQQFTTGNTHTAYIICRQVEQASKQLGIELSNATVAVCGATGDIGSAVCRWLDARTDVAVVADCP